MRSGSKGSGLLAALVAAGCWVAATGPALSLTDEEIFRGYQLYFLQSGSRALGMGGAFVAIADDATAVEANPAGLRSIAHPQLYLEYGSIDNDSSSTRSSRGDVQVNTVSGDRNLPYLSISSSEDPESSQVPALVSFSWPFSLGPKARRLSVAGSRQVIHSRELTMSDSDEATQVSFSFDSFPNTVGAGGQVQAYAVAVPVSGSLSSEIVHWNVVASYEVHPVLSVGLTLTHATLDLEAGTQVRVEDPMQILVSSSHPRLPSQPDTDVYTTQADGSDSDLTFAVGVLWHPGSSFSGGVSPWQMGASFRKGATFSIEESTFLNGRFDRSFENRISVPDEYAVGVSYRYGDRWTFAAELERVEYSDLVEQYESGVSYVTSSHLASGAFATRPGRPSQFKVNDGTIPRLGVEYRLPFGTAGQRLLAGRIGWYRTPDTQIRMTHFNSADPEVNSTYENAFPEGDAASHYTVGVGLGLGAYAFDLGFESSDIGNRLLATFIYEMGGK